MKISLAVLAAFVAAPALSQPVISTDGVVSAATYVPSGFPHSGIAQGSYFAVFGQNLGPAAAQLTHALPLQTNLAGTSIRVTVGAAAVDALIVFTSATQVNAVLPSKAPVGDGTLTVTFSGKTSAPASIRVVARSFGIFTRNMAGFGPAIVQNFVTQTQQPMNAVTVAARPGQVAILWGTGLGAISGDDAVAPTPGTLTSDVQVLVGGRSAPILYAGRSAQYPGIDQINFTVPEGVEGCYVPVSVKAGGVIGNYASMAISSTGNMCSDPTAISAADLAKVSGSGQARIGTVHLIQMRASTASLEVKIDEGKGSFIGRTLDQLQTAPRLFEYVTSLGTCTAYAQRLIDENDFEWVPNDHTGRLGLQTGPTLNLAGPNGAKQMAQNADPGSYGIDELGGGYDGPILPEYLVPGEYTVSNGTGGSEVGAFSAKTTLRPALNWVNRDSLADVNRGQDLTVRWVGGDPDHEFVTIMGVAASQSAHIVGSFVCTERPAAGQFTVPASILSMLPASTPWTGVGLPMGLLTLATQPLAETAKFAAPGLDFGYFTYAAELVSVVNYK